MKIALVIDDSLDRGDGVQQYVKTLGAYYTKHGHYVDYITTKSVDTQLKNIYSLSSSVRFRFNGNNVAIPLPIKIRKMRELLKGQQYDVVHIQLPYSPLFSGILLHNLSSNTVIIGTFHILPYGRIASIGTRILGVASNFSLKRFDAIYSVSKPAQLFANNVYGIKSKVLPNAVDVADFKLSIKTVPGTILFLGRLVERKGCADFLKIMTEVRRLYTGHLRIDIAGDGPERKTLEAMCRQLGLNTHTTFHGYVEDLSLIHI